MPSWWTWRASGNANLRIDPDYHTYSAPQIAQRTAISTACGELVAGLEAMRQPTTHALGLHPDHSYDPAPESTGVREVDDAAVQVLVRGLQMILGSKYPKMATCRHRATGIPATESHESRPTHTIHRVARARSANRLRKGQSGLFRWRGWTSSLRRPTPDADTASISEPRLLDSDHATNNHVIAQPLELSEPTLEQALCASRDERRRAARVTVVSP